MKFAIAVLVLLPLMAAESAEVSHGPRNHDRGQRSNLRKLNKHDPNKIKSKTADANHTESTHTTESSIVGTTEASIKSKTVDADPVESGITDATEAPCTATEPVCRCHVGKSVPEFHTEDICVGGTFPSNGQWRGVLGACSDAKLTCEEICGSDMYTCVHDMNDGEIGYCIPANEAAAVDSATTELTTESGATEIPTTESGTTKSVTTGSPENIVSEVVDPLVEKCRIWYDEDGVTIKKFKTKEGEPDENFIDKMVEFRGSCVELCDTGRICGESHLMCGEIPDEDDGEKMGVCYDPNETLTADTVTTGASESSGTSATPEVCCCHVGENRKMHTKCKDDMESCMNAGPFFHAYTGTCEENIAVWENPSVGDVGLQDVCGVSHICKCWVEKEEHDVEYGDENSQFVCHSECPDTGNVTTDKGKKGKKLRL